MHVVSNFAFHKYCCNNNDLTGIASGIVFIILNMERCFIQQVVAFMDLEPKYEPQGAFNSFHIQALSLACLTYDMTYVFLLDLSP